MTDRVCFDTLWTPGRAFEIRFPPSTHFEHATRTFLLGSDPLPTGRLVLYIWEGFTNGLSPRDGWQPIGLVDMGAREAVFESRMVNDLRYVGYVAGVLHDMGWTIEGIFPLHIPTCHDAGVTAGYVRLAHNGIPMNSQTRNTDANCHVHKRRAERRGNALMRFGETGERG